MAHFQLGPSGTRLFVDGTSGDEKLFVHSGNQIRLELAGFPRTSGTPKITVGTPNILSISDPKKFGDRWVFTVKATGVAKTVLKATDGFGRELTNALNVYAGMFSNHPGIDTDLIADVFRGSDPVKMNILTRMLHNDVGNLFNENSSANIKRWGSLACGTVSKVGGRSVFYGPLDYTYNAYHLPIPPKIEKVNGRNQKVWRLDSREDVKYEESKIQRGLKAIQQRLKRGIPSVLGLAYNPFRSIQPGGSLKPTGSGGHSVLVVGCDDKREKFLYIDVWGPNGSGEAFYRGSILKYGGGPAGQNGFPLVCEHLGLFEAKPDAARGGVTVVKQDPSTQAPGGMFSGGQYLEVISGPL